MRPGEGDFAGQQSGGRRGYFDGLALASPGVGFAVKQLQARCLIAQRGASPLEEARCLGEDHVASVVATQETDGGVCIEPATPRVE
jgi:hypothetical protein